MPEKKPVYQYTKNGVYRKSFASVEEAKRYIRKIKRNLKLNPQIDTACREWKRRKAVGYIWRYAEEIVDKSDRLIMSKMPDKHFRTTPEHKQFRKWYNHILFNCYNPKGIYYGKFKMWAGWKNSFAKFYSDMLPLYQKAKEAHQEYSSRKYKRKIKVTHIWFVRFDKTKGYTPENVCFTTPVWCIRYKPCNHRINIDGKVMFVGQIGDILKEQGRAISDGTITNRAKMGIGIDAPTHKRNYEYKGKFYSSIELAKKFGVQFEQIKNYVKKKGLSINKAVAEIKKYQKLKESKRIIYKGISYDAFQLALILKKKSRLKLEIIRQRLDSVYGKELTSKNARRITKTPKTKRLKIKYKNKTYTLKELAMEVGMEYHLLHNRYSMRGITKLKDLLHKGYLKPKIN